MADLLNASVDRGLTSRDLVLMTCCADCWGQVSDKSIAGLVMSSFAEDENQLEERGKNVGNSVCRKLEDGSNKKILYTLGGLPHC